jgi:glucosamine--fructose-6-phosphate aminotransferase (isomerizing)
MLGEKMEAEIREQTSVLIANSDAYLDASKAAFQRESFEMVLLAARGSSDHAALFARYLIEIHLGIPVVLAAPSVFTRYHAHVKYPKCLAIGISQSGAAPDVAEVLETLRDQGLTTLAITNTESSRLTKTANFTMALNVGLESSVAATKTYNASLLALYQLVRALGANLPDPKEWLPNQDWENICDKAAMAEAPRLSKSASVFTLARGYSYASALESALKLMECALIPAKGFSWADFQHGPTALAVSGSSAIVYGTVGEGLAERGCHVIHAPNPGCPPELAPIKEMVFGQYLALHASRFAGLDADTPPNLRKVTQTR